MFWLREKIKALKAKQSGKRERCTKKSKKWEKRKTLQLGLVKWWRWKKWKHKKPKKEEEKSGFDMDDCGGRDYDVTPSTVLLLCTPSTVLLLCTPSTTLYGLLLQFISNLRSVQIFQRNFCDRSIYSLYNFRGPAIDRSKFSKELCDRSNLKAITIQFLEKLWSIGPNFQRNRAIGPT
jgi:hypothetical protein